jgi:hypothetical protein
VEPVDSLQVADLAVAAHRPANAHASQVDRGREAIFRLAYESKPTQQLEPPSGPSCFFLSNER